MSTDTPSPSDLADKRDELDVTLTDVAEHLTDHPNYDLAQSTLSSRVGEWERGDREATTEDRAALAEALDEIEAEQNYTPPPCKECGRTPSAPTEDGICQICLYPDDDSDI